MSTKLSDVAKASARGSFFLFLGNTSSIIIMALASILIARFLGPENYGLYALAMIAPSFLIALSDVGISPALTRFSARFHFEGQDRKVVALIKAGIIFKSVLALFLSLVLVLLSESIATWVLKRPGLGFLICFASFYLVGQAIFETLNSIFIGLDKAENSCVLMTVEAVTKILASLALIVLGMGAIGAILGTGLGFLLAAGIGATVLLLRICPSLYSHNHREDTDFFQGLRLMSRYGMPLYLSILIFSFCSQYQTFILAVFASNMEVGNYAVAMNFSVLCNVFSYPIATSLFPAFSKLNIKEDRGSVENMFRYSVKYSSLLIIPASLAIVILSNEIVYTLYGLQYQLAPSYLALYTLSFLSVGLGYLVIGKLFGGQGDTKTVLRINLFNLILSLPLAPILTLLYGVSGLIASVLISQFASTVYGLSLVHRKYGLSLDWIASIRVGAASFFSALLAYLFLTLGPLSNPVYKLVAGALLYVTSFLIFVSITGAVNFIDVANLREIVSKLGPFTHLFNIPLNVIEKTLKFIHSNGGS